MNDDAQLVLSLLAEQGSRLQALLLRITLREDVAEDLLQELFLRLSRGSALRRARDPVGYAVTTATRLAFDWRRSQRRRRDAAPLVQEPVATPVACDLQDRQQLQWVLIAIDQLPRRQRDAVVMRYLEERPYEEIAAALGASVHHARAICYRGIVRLRKACAQTFATPVEDAVHEP
ncbi:MAG: RNA polymerase sigma factor [Planctomycetales bacterium]|nr:RNA polymerase sigma factor [Planctomycetales bacterium]